MDDYMFGTVMRESRLVKPLIEIILGIKIASVSYVEPQKSMKEGVNARGIQLDLFVRSEDGRVFNVEVQTTRKRSLPRRIRYYQSCIDMELLSPGVDYTQLNDSYVIFICNYDPFGLGRYLYRFENRCLDVSDLSLGDGAFKVIVNTKGQRGDVSSEQMEVIRYLKDGTVSGEYTRELEDAINVVKSSQERRHEYMLWSLREQELRMEGRAEGRAEGRMEGRMEERLQTVRQIMKNLGYTAMQAMNIMGIPSADQEALLKELGPLSS